MGADAATGSLGKRFFLHHVPKTGGSTVIHAVYESFGANNIIHPKKRTKGFFVDMAMTKKYENVPSARNSHIVGHFASLSIIEDMESEYLKVCFWRHPADFFLSYYNWRNNKDRHRQKRVYSFSDFERSLVFNPMTMDFLLYCGDVPGWRYFFASDRQKFDWALSLIDRFDSFADISQVNDYLHSQGLAEIGGAGYHNRISELNKVLKSLDTATCQRLQALNSVDYCIYRIAMGEDRTQVLTDAYGILSDGFSIRDVIRFISRPYYRFRVKVMPFF